MKEVTEETEEDENISSDISGDDDQVLNDDDSDNDQVNDNNDILVSGYHSDSDSTVMMSGNSPFVSKTARYNFLTRSG